MKNKKVCKREDVEKLIKEEGDFREFTYKGFTGMCVRQENGGNINGYVKIPETHVIYGKPCASCIYYDLAVHGGITFSGWFNNFDSWWIGFSTEHVDDFVPYSPRATFSQTYRTMDWVEKEVKSLIDQLLVIEDKK